MKMRPLNTILMSAYLSAMLASSVAPIRNSATLAGAIDPMAAQKALQNAVNGLDNAGWKAASTSAHAVPAPSAALTPVSTTQPKSGPEMNEELMGRLVKYTRGLQNTGTLGAGTCKVFELCDGTRDIAVKFAKSGAPNGIHLFGLTLDPNSKDILIMVQRGVIAESFLTDKTGRLRAAVIANNGVAQRISLERAEAAYKIELAIFAGEAAGLPPTAPVVARN